MEANLSTIRNCYLRCASKAALPFSSILKSAALALLAFVTGIQGIASAQTISLRSATTNQITARDGGTGYSNSVEKVSVSGSTVTVKYSVQRQSATHWVGLYKVGESGYSSWVYTPQYSGQADLTSAGNGDYYVVLYADNGYSELARTVSFSVGAGGASETQSNGTGYSNSVEKVSVSGSTVTFKYSVQRQSSTHWIGLYKAGQSGYVSWVYTPLPSGQIELTSAGNGDYYGVLYADNGYSELARTGNFQTTVPAAQPIATPTTPPQTNPTNGSSGENSNGWDCKVGSENGVLRMRSIHNNIEEFAWDIGPGGSMYRLFDLRNSSVTLLAPPFLSEITDRVIQWTLWNHSLRVGNSVHDALNTTQAGTGYNLLTPTMLVRYSKKNKVCKVWVVSHVKDQYSLPRTKHFETSVPALTTYEFQGGVLRISREVLLESVKKDGANITGLQDYYLEGWSPFSAQQFNALALSLDSSGKPDHFYHALSNIPHYPNIPYSSTRGWALLYHNQRLAGGVAIGLAYGREKSSAMTLHNLNTMEFEGNIAVLPSVKHLAAPVGSIITQHIDLYMTRGVSGNLGQVLDGIASKVPPASFVFPDDQSSYVKKLRSLLASVPSLAGNRTEFLGNLAVQGDPIMGVSDAVKKLNKTSKNKGEKQKKTKKTRAAKRGRR